VYVLAGGNVRLQKALELMRARVASTLVIDDGDSPGWPEARRLCGQRAPFRVVCFKANPFSTRGEAEALRRLVGTNHWSSIIAVTSSYHVTRARMILRRCVPGVRVVAAPMKLTLVPFYVAAEWVKLALALTFRRDC
jgi:uncharacterized SAM-binding protein YcdF (DUF218 family)